MRLKTDPENRGKKSFLDRKMQTAVQPDRRLDLLRREAVLLGSGAGSAALRQREVLGLQRTVGNRAVVEMLARHNSPSNGTVQAKPKKRDEFYKTDEIIEIDLGRISAQTPPIPPFEVISATTSAQFSRGELETEVEKLWKRERLTFTAAARKAAAKNLSNRQKQDAAIATQSPEIKPSKPYTRRWHLGLYAYDYQKWGDLPAIKRLLRKGSPFQQSLGAEFDRVINIANPTMNEMNAQIHNAIYGLFEAKAVNEAAELVVFYSGHGGGGAISGVDGQLLDATILEIIADYAADFGVHIVFVLDTCRGGKLASLAHVAASKKMGEAITKLPQDKQAKARHLNQIFSQLSQSSLHLKDTTIDMLDWSREYWKKRTKENNAGRMDSVMGLQAELKNFDEALSLQGLSEAEMPNLNKIRDLSRKLRFLTFYVLSGKREDTMSLLHDMAELLDILNDSLNSMMLTLADQIKTK